MRPASLVTWTIALIVCLGGAAGPAAAQSTNAKPVLSITDVPLDPAQLPWLSEETRNYVADVARQFQSGQITAFVIAAAPNGNYGVRTAYAGNTVEPSLSDMARGALEHCEYYYLLPCRIVAINNRATQDETGSWAEQPFMLSPEPARFDYSKVPFLSEAGRRALRDYAGAASPKALAISDNGYWAWKTGSTASDAITLALAECKTGNSNYDCMLYSLNNVVVLDLTR
jgi:hypothetical protein